jgi:hypothetical protein
MPIYRCSQCALVSEVAIAPEGGTIPCSRCGTPSPVYETVYYVQRVLDRYFELLREVNALKQAGKTETPAVSAPAPSAHSAPAKPGVGTKSKPQPAAEPPLDLGDINNTKQLATAQQHAPLQAWFAKHQIEATFDFSLVDTSGFYDDAARQIGDGFELFAELIDRVRYAYRKNQSWVNLALADLSQKDGQAVNNLCRQLYSHTFFARYNYQKSEKIVNLTLQTAPAVRQFFDGGWLEWYAFMQLIIQLTERKRSFSCARGVKVVFSNEDLHELDVFVLPDGQPPICIECKSGEFRRDIDKCLRIRKRLGLDKNRFIICASDLTDEQASGLSAMYDLTFVNLKSLGKHLQTVI